MPADPAPRHALWFEAALLPEGWRRRVRLVIEAGQIASLEIGVPASATDDRHAVGLPGIPNVHSHAFQRALAGLAEARSARDDDFWSWRELMYRFVGRIEPDDLEAISAQAYVEMLEGGFTHVGEFHYLHHDVAGRPYAQPGEMSERIAAAAATTGIGLTLLPVLYCQGGFGGLAAQPAQRRFVSDLDGYARLLEAAQGAIRALPGAHVGIAPHSLRAVTPAQLTHALTLAGSAPVHLHVAEQQAEVADCLRWCGQRPVEWLLAHAPVDSRWCLVHATHLSDSETAALAASGAVAGLCPTTEANLGDGLFAAAPYLAAGGRMAVGSDSNVEIGAAGELRLLEYGQRLTYRGRNVLATPALPSTGRRLVEAVAGGGARALGLPAPGIQPGAPADLLSLDGAHPSLVARTGDALLDSWVFAAGSSAVDCVWRHGRKLVVGGRHRDREAVAARYRRCMESLLP